MFASQMLQSNRWKQRADGVLVYVIIPKCFLDIDMPADESFVAQTRKRTGLAMVVNHPQRSAAGPRGRNNQRHRRSPGDATRRMAQKTRAAPCECSTAA